MELDEIFYAALTANSEIMEATKGRIFSTCIEVPPTDDDNTPLPYIIITDDPLQDDGATKDDVWEGGYDIVQSSIEISAESPKAVKQLRRLVRRAIAAYVKSMDDPPYLQSFTNEGIAWDWTKPCYYDNLHYRCEIHDET